MLDRQPKEWGLLWLTAAVLLPSGALSIASIYAGFIAVSVGLTVLLAIWGERLRSAWEEKVKLAGQVERLEEFADDRGQLLEHERRRAQARQMFMPDKVIWLSMAEVVQLHELTVESVLNGLKQTIASQCEEVIARQDEVRAAVALRVSDPEVWPIDLHNDKTAAKLRSVLGFSARERAIASRIRGVTRG